LRRIVIGLCGGGSAAEDLMQEGLIWLWLLEEQNPGQSPSWYLQGCSFHLRNSLLAGRSLDARKRERLRLSFFPNGGNPGAWLERWETETAILPTVSATELMSLLEPRLDLMDRRILRFLSEGFGVCDIAEKIRLSHQAVVKRRRKIAALACQLGFPQQSSRSGVSSARTPVGKPSGAATRRPRASKSAQPRAQADNRRAAA